MPNPWIDHIKKKMVELNINSFACALSDDRVKKSYKKKKEVKQEQSNSIDYKAILAENTKRLRDGNQEKLKYEIGLARSYFNKKPDAYKEEVKKRFPRTYLYLSNPDEYFKTLTEKEKKQLEERLKQEKEEADRLKKEKKEAKKNKKQEDKLKEEVKEEVKDEVKEEVKEEVKKKTKKQPKEEVKEEVKEIVKEVPKDKTHIKKLKSQLQGFKDNYNDEISRVKDALNAGIKPNKLGNIGLIKYYYKEYNDTKKLLEKEGYNVEDLEIIF